MHPLVRFFIFLFLFSSWVYIHEVPGVYSQRNLEGRLTYPKAPNFGDEPRDSYKVRYYEKSRHYRCEMDWELEQYLHFGIARYGFALDT